MEKLTDIILVVEGKSDEAFIKSFLDVEIVKTNGSSAPRGTLEYLKEASKNKTIIVLTDPDYPGYQIRNKVATFVPNTKHAFINKEDAIKHHKVGVAESSKEVVLEALNNLVTYSEVEDEGNLLTTSDLYDLGLLGGENSANLRQKVAKRLHLGHCNGKTFLKRLNYCHLSKEDLLEIINGQD